MLQKIRDLVCLVTKHMVTRTRRELGPLKAFREYSLNKRMSHDSHRNQLLRVSNNLRCQILVLIYDEKAALR